MTAHPNLLVLLSDQQRADTCGCYGQALPVTPHLDRLAAEGVRFANAFTCQPVCGPARAALQTGRWPAQVGCHVNGRALPFGIPTLPRLLRAAGYSTSYIGKWHLASDRLADPPEDHRTTAVPADRRGGWEDGFWLASDALEHTSHGYDGWMHDGEGRRRDFPPGRFRADVLTDWTIDCLRERDRSRPFVLMVSWLEPHHQNDRDRFEAPHGLAEHFRGYVPPGDLAPFAGNWRQHYPDYLALCHNLDANLGRILAALAEEGVLDDTLVAWTADHGCHFRTRNREYKRSCHDASLRIPLVLRGPGFRGGETVQRGASLVDLPTTLLAAAGVTADSAMVGRDLAVARDPRQPWDDDIYAQVSEHRVGRVLRTPRWTYMMSDPAADPWRDAFGRTYHEEYLYDNLQDPHQLINRVRDAGLAGERAAVRERLLRLMAAAGEPPATVHLDW